MTVISDNAFPKIILTEGSAPSAAATGAQKLFIASSDHHIKLIDHAGTVTDLQAASGGVDTPPPVASTWTWVNQGGATLTDVGSSVLLSAPSNSGDQNRLAVVSAPATPYKITAHLRHMIPALNYIYTGLVFRESSSGKLVLFGLGNTGQFYAAQWTNTTSYSASYTLNFQPTGVSADLWLSIEDTGTNRVLSAGLSPSDMQVLHTVGRTDFLTANQVGFGMNVNNSSYGAALRLLSWSVS